MTGKGRKKGSSGEQSRALLLSIAAKEFAQKGYYETKISDIVKQADLSQPSFYLYFESKEAIFAELVTLFRSTLFDFTKSSRLESGIHSSSLANKITQGLTTIFHFFVEQPDLTRIGFYIAQEAEEIKNSLANQIRENLTFEMQEGYFTTAVDMETVAESLVGIIDRVTITKLLPGHKEPEALAHEIVSLILYGIQNQTTNNFHNLP
ncbi:TetR/AcrR family transcriptional regulator [Neobacillus sp. FSL H8-0543]|uniref:TetR/AcrR family transcriptional regulator n=1 Tax=Neobacillus sp. FSL H8-0543 TaxID=2954672 RepID=UPI0031599059